MKIKVKDEVVREIELPQYFKVDNTWYSLKESYYIKVCAFADFEIQLGFLSTITVCPISYIVYDLVKGFEKVTETEFKINYLKASNNIEKLL